MSANLTPITEPIDLVITQEMIDYSNKMCHEGGHCRIDWCPLALAAKKVFGPAAYVSIHTVELNGKSIAVLSPEARFFQVQFDRKRVPEPGTYRILPWS